MNTTRRKPLARVAAALLAWLYLLARVVVASAMLDAARWEQRQATRGAE